MKAPTITLDDDQEVAIDRLPLPALRAFANGDFKGAELGPYDSPVVAQAIAAKLIEEHDLGVGGMR